MTAEISERYTAIDRRITEACRAAGRARDEITLIAVSKEQPLQRLQALYELGHRHFGENKVQALDARIQALPMPDIHWHQIGPIQSNKAKDIARLAASHRLWVHTLDRPSLLKALSRRLEHPLTALIQVQPTPEASKSGLPPDALADFISSCQAHPLLKIQGLMAIPPPLAVVGEAATRAHFSLLAQLQQDTQLPYLSLGMSDDFELAIAAGATHIRVGSALFGPRPALDAHAPP